MNILSIGNSFSQDAQRYIHRIAKSDGFELKTFNLYIGGCSLWEHFRNISEDKKDYSLEMNGESTGFFVSIKEALLTRRWDVVTLQQASLESMSYKTYQPYLDKVAEYVREYAPNAKFVIHQTWAYEDESSRLADMGYENSDKMFVDVEKAYKKAAQAVKADMIVPSGELIQKLHSAGAGKLHRDGYHLSYGLGRYAVGLLWYKLLSKNDISGNVFCDFDEEITESEIKLAKECVDAVADRYLK